MDEFQELFITAHSILLSHLALALDSPVNPQRCSSRSSQLDILMRAYFSAHPLPLHPGRLLMRLNPILR